MTSWNEYLTSQGARHSATEPGRVLDFGRAPDQAELAGGFIAAVTSHGVIGVSGEEAASFLHKQLTNDVEHLGLAEVRLAGYCTPKGRLQASFLMWRNAESVFLQLPRELQPALQKRLSMFVMRAKAKLADATPEACIGFGGARAQAALEQLFGALPATPYSKIDHALGTLMRLADAFGAPRYQWLASAEAAQAAWPSLAATLAVAGDDAWNLSSIHAGVPEISLKTQEQFVPQMVNFELLGGVNFKKGCYPGQEVVARSQFRGTLKRRAYLVHSDVALVTGDEVFGSGDAEQACGTVAQAAPSPAGGFDAIVSMQITAALGGGLTLGSATGSPLSLQTLPYPLLEDI